MTAKVTGSIFFMSGPSHYSDDEIAHGVDPRAVSGFDDGCCIKLFENGRPHKLAVQGQTIALIDRGVDPALFQPDAAGTSECTVDRRSDVLANQNAQRECLALADDSRVQIDDDRFDFGKRH